MLSELYIENIAIIEKSSIDLYHGFNLFTGETGAGKSILIDSINLVLGGKASRELIRTGASRALVSARFTQVNPHTLKNLSELGFSTEDAEVLITREFSVSGRTSCKINGQPATVSILREVGANLINIHGQHDSQALLLPERHIGILDEYAGLSVQLEEYHACYQKLLDCRTKLEHFSMDEAQKARQIDLLRFQIDEIEQAQLQPGEEEELAARRDIIRNAENIQQSLTVAHLCLSGSDDVEGAISLLRQASEAAAQCGTYLAETEQASQKLLELSYEAESLSEDFRTELYSVEFNPAELDEIEERLELIYRLRRKYGNTIEEILSYLEKIKRELDEIEFSEEKQNQLQQKVAALEKKAEKLASMLSQKRSLAAVKFSSAVQKELTFLDMPKVRFEVHLSDVPLHHNGKDHVQFLISTNPGEPPKLLSKIASGGELSRIMLAIKNVIADKDPVDTLIFDEIDTGVSGRAAEKIGRKLKQLSTKCQVICITHLAQIAALADAHLLIEKHSDEAHTFTQVSLLDEKGRIEELSRIIGGSSITQLTRENAREMLMQANKSLDK